MNEMFIASLINSMFRYTTPILFATLGSLICTRCNVFNVALEGQMLIASFAAIVVNYYTQNVLLCLIVAMASGMLIGWIVAIFQIKLQARDMVVGTAMNLFVSSAVSFLMQIIFHTRGTIQGSNLVSLPKVQWNMSENSPFLGRVFENLSIVDYLGYIVAVLMFIYLFKTVGGFHLRSVGINKAAAESLGIKAERIQMGAIIVSGALCGIGGIAQSMGNVTMFVENMTAGRGFIAMGASSMAQSHPLVGILSSMFFGVSLSLTKTLQSYINSYFTSSIPYLCTVMVMVIYGIIITIRKKVRKTHVSK